MADRNVEDALELGTTRRYGEVRVNDGDGVARGSVNCTKYAWLFSEGTSVVDGDLERKGFALLDQR